MLRLNNAAFIAFWIGFQYGSVCLSSETFIEKIKVYGIIKPGKISTLIGVNQGIVNRIEQVGTTLKQNEAAIQVMERELTRPYRSTIDGVVAKNHVTIGAAVTPGMPLVTIIDPNSKDIELSLSPAEAKKVRVGAQVFDKQQVLFGSIAKVSPLVDIDTGAVVSYVKSDHAVASLIGDVIPLFVHVRTITDCDRIVKLHELDSQLQQMTVEAYSGDQVCLKAPKQTASVDKSTSSPPAKSP